MEFAGVPGISVKRVCSDVADRFKLYSVTGVLGTEWCSRKHCREANDLP